MTEMSLVERIAALDTSLFASIETQTSDRDRRSILALHHAVASTLNTFGYLEIGSYKGGSLQVVMRDPRCARVMSIDPRPAVTPDARSGTWAYEDNSTEEMLSSLASIPQADMRKITTFESDAEKLDLASLSAAPDFCFIDGEHTNGASLRDARVCARAIGSSGVIAFHDHVLVREGIKSFLREVWDDVSFALAVNFPPQGAVDGGGVFAVELGGARILRAPIIDQVVGSRWHSVGWAMTSRWRSSPRPLETLLGSMPSVDTALVEGKRRLRRARQRKPA